jgi:cytochrome c556
MIGLIVTPLRATLTVLLTLSLSGIAHAQDKKIEQAIKHRRAAFTLMSTYFSRLLQTVEGDRPFDARQVALDSKMVEVLSRLPWEGFAPGTDHGDTRAKEDIWLEEEKFKKLGAEFEAKATLLAKAGESVDIKRLKQAFESTRDTCTVCHKAFRKT